MIARRLGRALLCAAALALVACEPDIEAIGVDPLSTPPVAVLVRDDSFRLVAGTGLGVDLFAYTEDPEGTSRDVEPVDPDLVRVETSDDQIVTVSHVEGPTYIVAGARPGTAFLEISSQETNGIFRLPVEVVAQ
jgi:hypothetical protein